MTRRNDYAQAVYYWPQVYPYFPHGNGQYFPMAPVGGAIDATLPERHLRSATLSPRHLRSADLPERKLRGATLEERP